MGVAYNSSLAATGGAGGYVFSIASGSLPAGLTLNASTGAITGTPTAYGTSSFTAKVVDSTGTTAGTTTSSCSIVIAPPIALTCAVATGQMGVAYNSSLAATGGAGGYVFSIASGSLPAGLTLNASTGAITGTPTAAGISFFTSKAHDSTSGDATNNCSITVVAAQADVSITNSGPAIVAWPANITYNIVVANAGPSPAASVTVTDVLPTGTTFVSATPSQGSCSGTSTVSCSLGAVAAGGSATVVVVVVSPRISVPVVNTATVVSTTPDPNTANNRSTTILTMPTSIPTLSTWGLALAALLLAGCSAQLIRIR
jgi:uncharacterized repeat protein (TIGR01451 family)